MGRQTVSAEQQRQRKADEARRRRERERLLKSGAVSNDENRSTDTNDNNSLTEERQNSDQMARPEHATHHGRITVQETYAQKRDRLRQYFRRRKSGQHEEKRPEASEPAQDQSLAREPVSSGSTVMAVGLEAGTRPAADGIIALEDHDDDSNDESTVVVLRHRKRLTAAQNYYKDVALRPPAQPLRCAEPHQARRRTPRSRISSDSLMPGLAALDLNSGFPSRAKTQSPAQSATDRFDVMETSNAPSAAEAPSVLSVGDDSIGGGSVDDGSVDDASVDDDSVVSISALEFNPCFSASTDETTPEPHASATPEPDTTSPSDEDIPMMDDSPAVTQSTPQVRRPQPVKSQSPHLDRFRRAMLIQERRGEAEFLTTQAAMYESALATFFSMNCCCTETLSSAAHPESCTMRDVVEHIRKSLPPLLDIFAEGCTYDHRAYFHKWRDILSNKPTFPLSLQKTQDTLRPSSVSVSQTWDIDSAWFAMKGLGAIRPPNEFRLVLLPRFGHNLTTDQIIQPHGLTLAKTRHVLLGYFQAGSIRFSVFVFFPTSAKSRRSKTSASSNMLSHERLRELYDDIVLPAIRETISHPFKQEIPPTYDMIYAKSRVFQEQPSGSSQNSEHHHRSSQLEYAIPAREASRFWLAFAEKAKAHRITTKRGEQIAYFEDARLVAQSHNMKHNTTGRTVRDTMSSFSRMVLASLDPEHLDLRSCYFDLGARYFVDDARNTIAMGSAAYSLLWKSQCNRNLHKQLAAIAPDSNLSATYYRSHLLRDTGNLISKCTPTASVDPGHPDCRQPSLIRAKAYSAKDLVKAMDRRYRPFSADALPLLSLTQDMIQDLDSTGRTRERVFSTRHNRELIRRAWEANKAHVRAMADPRVVANYGVRKEITLCLGPVLKMWSEGKFDATENAHFGAMSLLVTFNDSATHCPFWVVPTNDYIDLILAQAARLVLPVEHLFREASLAAAGEARLTTAESSLRRILALYTAQLFCRLLILNFSSAPELNYDNWIWKAHWTTKDKRRYGLGLDAEIEKEGMLWIPHNIMNWRGGNLSLSTLIRTYIPRSPLQAQLLSQINIRKLTTNQLTVEYMVQEWVLQAQQAFDGGRAKEGSALANRVMELCAEEVARAYNQHLLQKMVAFWDRVRAQVGRKVLPKLRRLQRALDDVAAEKSHIVTALTIWEVYADAWAIYSAETRDRHGTEIPADLPCWMASRKHSPTKNGWSDFVYDHIFGRSEAKWKNIYFLQTYRTFAKYWEPIQSHAGQFNNRFRRVIGRYVKVMFNCNQAKEVNTNHTNGTWYHKKPPFFQIQYWAPYFSPPENNAGVRVDCETTTAPSIMSAVEFQDLENVVHNSLLQIVSKTDRRQFAHRDAAVEYYTTALWGMVRFAGPTWGSRGMVERVEHVMPWRLSGQDAFRVPLRTARQAEDETDEQLSQPTVMLPTRENVRKLFHAIQSRANRLDPSRTTELARQLKWIKRRLCNEGIRYDICGQLDAKSRASELEGDSPSLLREFLKQTVAYEEEIGPRDLADMRSEAGEESDSECDTDIGSDEEWVDD